jgi:hypothetical protein
MVLFNKLEQHHIFIMNEFKNKLGKFFIIIGGLSIVLFAFSIIAESVDFYLLITGILVILFGTILRRKPKLKISDQEELKLSNQNQGRNNRSDRSRFDQPENRQSRRSKRSKFQ